jgi:hypothetical protein
MEAVHALCGLGHLCSHAKRVCLGHVARDLLDLRPVPCVLLKLAAEPA